MGDTVGVIGAGIGGATVALQLAEAGYRVILIDKAKEPMSRTSGMNPGRSALGFHYTDESTGYQLIEGTKQFDRFFPDMRIQDGGARYFVVKESQVSKDTYLAVCDRLKQKYADDNLGDPDSFYRILEESEYQNDVAIAQVVLGIQTKEQLINMPKLVACVRQRLQAEKNIEIITERELLDAEQKGDGFTLVYKDRAGLIGSCNVDQVVNATWEYRHKIDALMGYRPSFLFTNRLKLLAKVKLPQSLRSAHSMMFVRGPFAMMANSRDETAFLTYAPITNYKQTSDIDIPSDWEEMITGQEMTEEKRTLGQKIIEGAAQYIPKLSDATLLEVRAGVIYSAGDADPFDPVSDIHSRERSGISEIVPGWISLDTGKLIFGPLYASQVVREFIQK